MALTRSYKLKIFFNIDLVVKTLSMYDVYDSYAPAFGLHLSLMKWEMHHTTERQWGSTGSETSVRQHNQMKTQLVVGMSWNTSQWYCLLLLSITGHQVQKCI